MSLSFVQHFKQPTYSVAGKSGYLTGKSDSIPQSRNGADKHTVCAISHYLPVSDNFPAFPHTYGLLLRRLPYRTGAQNTYNILCSVALQVPLQCFKQL